ncbi:MAG TPA: hypothetical protein VGG17_07930 [Acidimicrobiales bacterium]|jgi:hypothetical protein
MSQGFGHLRVPARLIALLCVSAVVLASCGTSAVVVKTHLDGTPAISISVPLSAISCTLNDVCVTVGTATNGDGPTSVAEFSSPKGNWFNLAIPATFPTLLNSVACSGFECLLGGSRPGQDLLFQFNSHGHTLMSVVPPSGGIGITALTCNATTCALVDSGTTGEPRFSVSSDAGTTWTNPAPVAWAKGDAITAFACGSALECAVGVLSASHAFSLYVTTDGGATWNESTTPSAWTALTSLSCVGERCEGLASTSSSSLLVRSKTFARTWKSVKLAQPTAALACFTFSRCVAVGERSSAKPWLATIHDDSATDVDLRYVPSPLLSVACGSKVCAAIGVTTLVNVPVPS